MSANTRDLKGSTAVVTGAGGLLGRAMCLAFAREGMDVVVSDLDADGAQETADLVAATGRRAVSVTIDVSDRAAVEDLAATAYDAFGRVNLLVNNAGLAVMKPFAELTYEDWDRVFGVQFGGVLNGVQAFLPRMLGQGDSFRYIVNVASMSGVGRADLRTFNAPYVAAKFAVVGLTETMAPALEEAGVGASVLCPGLTLADPTAISGVELPPSAAWYGDNALTPEPVAEETVRAIVEKRLHIFPHRAGRQEVIDRHSKLLEGFDQADRTSPPMTSS